MNRRTICSLAVGSALVTISTLASGLRIAAQDAEEVVKILDDARGTEQDIRETKSEDATASEGESEPDESRPLFYFRDDSKVAGEPDLEFIEVRTSYGLLKVPMSELVRVRFARRVSPEMAESIDRLIEQLGDEDFETRQKASDALGDIGAPALPALRKAVKSMSEEVKRKAEELLSEIYAQEDEQQQANGERDGLPQLQGTDDELMSTRMTIKGQVTQDQFAINSRYGRLTVDTAMLAGIVFRVVGPSSRQVSVAASFQPPGNWFDSRLDIEHGQRIRIAASGVISVSNYGVSCGPDGTTQYATNRSFDGLPVLSLVGKIGKRGKAFLIGSSHKGKAAGSGKLYLAITPFYYNPGGAIGNYQVKIDIESE